MNLSSPAGRGWRRVLLAQLPPLGALAIQGMFWPYIQPFAWLLFYPAVFISGWIGGLAGGGVATLLSTLLVVFFFIPPELSFAIENPRTLFSAAMFVGMGGLLAYFHERLRKANRAVAQALASLNSANRQLEARVKERTAELERINDSLRENEELFSKAFRLSPDCVVIVRISDLVVIRANEALGRLWGYAPEDVIGKPTRDYTSWVSEEERREFMRIVAEKGECLGYETTLRMTDGRSVPFSVSTRAITFNREPCLLSVMRDITERRQAEAARMRVAAIVESSDDAIIGKDLQGIVLSWNSGAEKIFGYTAAEMVGASIKRIIPDDRAEEERVILDRITRGESVQHFETVRVRKDGERLDISLTVSPIKDVQGRLVGASKIARDITARKRTEEALRTSQAELQAAMASMTDAVFISDVEGRFIEFNEAFATFHKFPSKEACAKTLAEYPAFLEVFLPGGEPAPLEQWAVSRALRGETVRNAEYRLRRKDTGEAWVGNYSFAPIRDRDGAIVGSVVTGRDVTEERAAAERLRENEERLRSLVEMMPEAMLVGQEGRVVYINERGVRLWRATRADQIVGRSLLELIHPDSYEQVRARLQQIEVEGAIAPVEESAIVALEGTRVPVERTAASFRYGGKTAIQVIIRDITERKRAEAAVRESNERFASMFNSSPVATSLTTVREGRYLDVNAAFLEMFEQSRDEVVGHTVFELNTWVDLRRRDAMFAEFKAHGSVQNFEMELRAKSGRSLHLLWSGVQVVIDGEDCLLGSGLDITEHKRREAEIHRLNASLEHRVAERTAELSDLYNNAPCGYHSLDADGLIVRINDTELRWLGYTREEIVGQVRIMDLFTPASAEIFRQNYSVFKARGVLADLELELVRKDGSILPLLVNATVLTGADGRFLMSRSTAIDYTARRRAELQVRESQAKLEAANKELEAFSYSVSHDLRAPLRAVVGFSRIVIEDYGAQLPAEGRRVLDNIARGGQQMGVLIDDLLTFSRLSRLNLAKRPVNVTALVQEVLDDLAGLRTGRAVELRIGDLPACEGDPALLRQVWINLLSNALKYTARRETAVVEIGCERPAGENVYFVRDNGAGFDMRYAGKLFGVFQRLHRSEDYEGTGVGLAIVQRVVHRHGGRVWAQAEEDRGATFFFTLETGKTS